MPRYLLLIYGDENALASASPEEIGQVMTEYQAYTDAVRGSGAFVAGEALQPTATATTVRTEGGRTVTSDGPFAETKEQLGGFYMVDCKDLDEAIEWGSKIPGVKNGAIEVRPVLDYPEASG